MDDIHNQAGSPVGPRPLAAKDVAQFLRRWLWLIFLAPLAISGSSLAFSLLQTPTYEASATVLVGQQQAQGHSSPARVEELQALIPSALEIITTRPVAEEATSGFDLGIDPEAVLENLSAEQTIESGQLIEVSYTDTDARRSELLVNAVGEVTSERISRLPMGAHDIKATVVEAARVPSTPEEPDPLRNAILAGGLGTMIGFGLAFKGNATKNEIRGLRGADYIAGKERADDLYGNRGKDEVRAGNGKDRVFGGRGRDQLYGGGGNDTMNTRDGYKDNVNCGLGTDTAYVDRRDRVNEDCENVFVSGGPEPDPVVEKVSGKGELGSAYGNPRLRVNAESAGPTPDDARGTFSITYPGDPDVARDNTYVRGPIRCLAISDKEARLVGRIGSASGPRADNGTFQKGEYVRIGVLDNATSDKANFSPGEQTFTSCNGETPNLDVLEGNFVVEEDV